MIILNRDGSRQPYRFTCSWSQIADWIARHDHHIPVYHQLCLHAWLWAFKRSVAGHGGSAPGKDAL